MNAPRLVALAGRRAARRADEAGELAVVIACHHLVCAVPVRRIDRLMVAGEAALVAGARLVLAGERLHANFNLGTILGLAPLDAAWVLLRVPHRGGELPVALQTGRCLVVQHLVAGAPLPPSVFQRRDGAVSAVFASEQVRSPAARSAQVGLWLDPARLLDEGELDAAAAELGAARSA